MTTTMMTKIAEAKKMMQGETFCPSQYEDMRYQWKASTPSWSTLKKYATEIGLQSKEQAYEWHSDGSMLAELCGIADGTICYYTVYYFED